MRQLLVSRSPADTTHGHIMAEYGNEECPRRWLTSHQKHVECVCRAIASGCGSDLEAAPESSGARQCDSAARATGGSGTIRTQPRRSDGRPERSWQYGGNGPADVKTI